MLYFAFIVFFGTYLLIASEKIHKTAAALMGAVLMMLLVLPGPGHNSSEGLSGLKQLFQSGAVAVPAKEMPALESALSTDDLLTRKAEILAAPMKER